MEPAFQMIVAAQRMHPMLLCTQHMLRLPRERLHCVAGSDGFTTRYLSRDVSHRAPGNAGHSAQQVPRLRVLVKHLRHLSNTAREVRCGTSERFCDVRKGPLRSRSYRSRNDRQQFAGSHPNQRQKMLGRFVFTLGLRSQFAEMFHHRVRIDFPDWTELVFIFEFARKLMLEFAFFLELALSKQASGNVADGPEPTFTFAFGFQLKFALKFAFELPLEFSLELIFKLCHAF